MASTNRILVKMSPQAALGAAAGPQTNLRPLYDMGALPAAAGFGISATPQWFIADLPDWGPEPVGRRLRARCGPTQSGGVRRSGGRT
jgi:hypothetical protein